MVQLLDVVNYFTFGFGTVGFSALPPPDPELRLLPPVDLASSREQIDLTSSVDWIFGAVINYFTPFCLLIKLITS